MKKAKVTLVPLEVGDREQFILDNQWAFKYGAMLEFGERDNHINDEGEIISRKTIERCIDSHDSEAYRIVCEGKKVGGVILKINKEEKRGELEILFVCADPSGYLGKFIAELHALIECLSVRFAVNEEFGLADDTVRASEAVKHLIEINNLIGLIGGLRLLTVTEGRIGYPDLLGHIHRNASVIEGYLRNLIIGIDLAEEIWIRHVLQRIFILLLLKQI